MKKRFQGLGAAVLLCLMLWGCGVEATPSESSVPNESTARISPTSLDTQRREEILTAWKAHTDYGSEWGDISDPGNMELLYYGSWNGYDILFCDGPTLAVSHIQIADSVFSNGQGIVLEGYKNGVLTPLSELYEQGQLTKLQIAEISEVHNWCHHLDLETNFREYFGCQLQWYDPETGEGVRDYGTYYANNTYFRLLFVPKEEAVATERVYEGVSFHSDRAFDIYKFDGGFEKLEASGMLIFSIEDVYRIHQQYE